MVKRALIVGINYKDSEAELKGCLNDCKNIYWLLRKRFGFERDNIAGLLESDATKANILNGFKWLVSKSKPGDTLFFSYSGHGGSKLDRNGDERDGRDETIIPFDWASQGEIIDDQIKLILSKIPDGVKFFGLFDSCHSGTILDLKYSLSKVRNEPGTENFSFTNINDTSRKNEYKGKVVCISGCLDSQTSADTFEEGMHRGAMTWAFEKVISNNFFKLTLVEIIYKMRKILSENKYSQTAQLNTNYLVQKDTLFDL